MEKKEQANNDGVDTPLIIRHTSRFFSYPAFIIALFILSFVCRFISYTQTDFANGWDSYFYLIQIKAFLEEGSMHSKDLSLIYLLMILIQLFTEDYVTTYKLTCALLASVFTLCIWRLSLQWSGSRKVALALMAFSVFSPHLTYFAGQYPKNMLGIIFFLLLLMAIQSKKMAVILGLLVLNFFGHRMTAVLSIITVLLFYILNRKPGLIVIGLIASAILIPILGLFLPGLLSIADMERLNGFITVSLHFAPYSFIKSFGVQSLSVYWIIEIVIVTFLFLAALFKVFFAVKNSKREIQVYILLLLCFLLIFPFLSWSMESIGYRLFHLFVLLTPMLLISYERSITKKVSALVVVIFLPLSLASFKSYNPQEQDPPYALYDRITERIVNKLDKADVELIIAHKSLAEYITFCSGIDAMPWIPEYEINSTKLWRVITDINETELNYYTEGNRIIKLSSQYYLLNAKDWHVALVKIESEDKDLFNHLNTWKNPSLQRPQYLLKNKR